MSTTLHATPTPRLGRKFAIAAVFAGLSAPALATPLAYEGFGPSFPIYANGGSGFNGPWAQGGFNAFASGYVPRDRSLCNPGLQVSGGSVSANAFPAINGAIRNLALTLSNQPVVYVSFLVQPRGQLDEGVFSGFFGLTLNGQSGNDLFIGKPGGGATGQYVLENRGGFGQVSSGASAVVGRTTLLVLKAEFIAGNDQFSLYVDPRSQSEPAASAVKNDLDLGAVSRIGIYSTGAFTIDEIRIGTTYADVLPARNGGSQQDAQGCLTEPN